MLKPINETTYDFPELIEGGFIYVDKTATLQQLIANRGAKLCFISRPRRFGKSLMLSTLKAIFQGRRELFEGLAIAKTDYDWSDVYPVLHFDFGTMDVETQEGFETEFVARIEQGFAEVQVAYDHTTLPSINFGKAINELAERHGKPVVVLIDEYDAPVGHALADPDKAETIRNRMAAFYGQLKVNVAKIRFLMMTGVTKFTQLSVFSALNNLKDFTLSAQTVSLLGYTEEELEVYFGEHMRAHAEVMGLDYATYREQFKHWYNGYRFSPDSEVTVYNPVSVAKTLGAKRRWFGATWPQTGHASVLMRYLERTPLDEMDYECVAGQSEDIFNSYSLRDIKPVTLLTQGGYLTIKDYDPDFGYTLGVPNEEVRRDLNALRIDSLHRADADALVATVRTALLSGDFPRFLEALKSYYAGFTYGSREDKIHEANYQRLLAALLSAGGLSVIPEATQAGGRADVVATSRLGHVYIFELKVGGTAQEALAQIHARDYAAPYRAKAQAIHLFGLAFDPAKHTLTDVAVETLPA